MIKFVLLVSIFIFNIHASTISFEEEKYIEVIDNTLLKKGTLNFKKDQITLKYQNSNRVLIYKDDNLTIENGNGVQTIDLNKQIALKMVFLLIEAIHKNDLNTLNEYFKISKTNKTTTLKPLSSLSNYIEGVEFKKDKKLDFITIKMTNGNITTIRELND